MKIKNLILSLFCVFNLTSLSVIAQRVQIIHNAADPALASVDVWVQGSPTPLFTNFAFRSATDYQSLLPGNYVIELKAPGSTAASPALYTSPTLALSATDTLIVFANGVANPANFAANPSGTATAFNLFTIPGKIGSTAGNFSLNVFHGASDAPAVDVINLTTPASAAPLLQNLAYVQSSGFVTLPAADYRIGLTGNNSPNLLGVFSAPLQTLNAGGLSGVVFASGFLDPSANQNGAAFGLFVALQNGTVIELPVETAELQAIHNAADPGAEKVDVEIAIGSYRFALLEDFAFRSATPYLKVPSGLELSVKFFAPNGTTPLATYPFTLAKDQAYVAMAYGVLNPAGFNAGVNPSIAFDLKAAPGQKVAPNSSTVSALIFHGASDAPTVDIKVFPEGSTTELATIPNLAYGSFTGAYADLPAQNLVITVGASPNNALVVAAAEAKLGDLNAGGAAAVIFASGFLDPSLNSNGKPFALVVALPDGTVLELPEPYAKLQAIHNSPDPIAKNVDIVISAGPRPIAKIANVGFRQATAYTDLPARVNLSVEFFVAGTTTSAGSFPFTLSEQKYYVAMATGVVASTGFNTSVNNDIAFTVKATEGKALAAAGSTDVLVYHGATDAPNVDVINNASGSPITGLANVPYGAFSAGYLNLPTADYVLGITPAGANTTKVGLYNAPLQTLAQDGKALVVFASGFLDSTANSNGAAFALFAALPDGTVLRLPEPASKVQVIHNSPDPAAKKVDVVLKAGPRLLAIVKDFDFREATPFINWPAGIGLTVKLQVGGADAASFDLPGLDQTKNYVVFAQGVVDPAGFEKPAGRNIDLKLNAFDGGKTAASNSSKVELLINHGSTDAPAVDIYARGVPTAIVPNLDYGQFAGYLALDPAKYTIDLTGAGSPDVVASYEADLANYAGLAAVVFASGFFTPEGDPAAGEGFGLFVAIPQGQVFALKAVAGPTSVAEVSVFGSEIVAYPNPAADAFTLKFNLNNSAAVKITLTDLQGRAVKTVDLGVQNVGVVQTSIDVSGLSAGAYLYQVQSGSSKTTGKLLIAR